MLRSCECVWLETIPLLIVMGWWYYRLLLTVFINKCIWQVDAVVCAYITRNTGKLCLKIIRKYRVTDLIISQIRWYHVIAMTVFGHLAYTVPLLFSSRIIGVPDFLEVVLHFMFREVHTWLDLRISAVCRVFRLSRVWLKMTFRENCRVKGNVDGIM